MEQILFINVILLWVSVLFNLVLVLAVNRRVNNPSNRKSDFLKMGQPAPSFSAETMHGDTVTLDTYVGGRTTGFVFVSPSCQPCHEEIPILEGLGPNAQRSGVDLVLVSTVEKSETQSMVDSLGIHLPVLVAPRGINPFMEDYKVGGTPFYCLVDAAGKVQGTGFLDQDWRRMTASWGKHVGEPSQAAVSTASTA